MDSSDGYFRDFEALLSAQGKLEAMSLLDELERINHLVAAKNGLHLALTGVKTLTVPSDEAVKFHNVIIDLGAAIKQVNDADGHASSADT